MLLNNENETLLASLEIFLITPELINILIRLLWVGVKENKKWILTKDPQHNPDLNQDYVELIDLMVMILVYHEKYQDDFQSFNSRFNFDLGY